MSWQQVAIAAGSTILGKALNKNASSGGGAPSGGSSNGGEWKSGAIQAGGQILSALMQKQASGTATKEESKHLAEALAFEREKEARRRAEYDQMIAAEKAQWEAEQARIEPYRNASLGILGGAADRLGFQMPQASTPALGAAAAKASKNMSLPTSDYLPGGSLASLSGSVPSMGGYERPPSDIETPMTLAELSRLRRPGDWRRGRNA